MDDGTWGFLTTPKRLDAEPRPRQFLLCRECFTKTFPLPLISFVWDLRRGLVDFCLKKRYCSEVKPSCCLSVIFSIFTLHFWQICLCYLTHRFSILPGKQGTPPPASTSSALLDKSNASQGNLIETLRDLWTERIGQEPGSQPTLLLMGSNRAEAQSICQLPFTRLA